MWETSIENVLKCKSKIFLAVMVQWNTVISYMSQEVESILNKRKSQEVMDLSNMKTHLMLRNLKVNYKKSNCMEEL